MELLLTRNNCKQDSFDFVFCFYAVIFLSLVGTKYTDHTNFSCVTLLNENHDNFFPMILYLTLLGFWVFFNEERGSLCFSIFSPYPLFRTAEWKNKQDMFTLGLKAQSRYQEIFNNIRIFSGFSSFQPKVPLLCRNINLKFLLSPSSRGDL